MNKNGFSRCADIYIGRLREEGRYSTAHVYQNALLSFSKFCGVHSVSFRQVTRDRLRRSTACSMRSIRGWTCVRKGRFLSSLFAGFFMKVPSLTVSAVPRLSLLWCSSSAGCLSPIWAIWRNPLLIATCCATIVSRRRLPWALRFWTVHRRCSTNSGTGSLPVPAVPTTFSAFFTVIRRAYREYQSALRRFNYCLKSLAKRLRLNFPVTSYTLRHSWATTAKYRGVPIEMISESLGHKSIKTTQIYLKGFELKERTEVNRMNLSYVKRCGVGQCIWFRSLIYSVYRCALLLR